MPVMSRLVVHGATLRCNRGSAPAPLTVARSQDGDDAPLATVDDHVPGTHLAPFGSCQSLDNPAVQAATAAAGGTLAPQPCQPIVPAPWTDETSFVEVDGRPAVVEGATCACQWGGTIEVVSPGSDHTAEG